MAMRQERPRRSFMQAVQALGVKFFCPFDITNQDGNQVPHNPHSWAQQLHGYVRRPNVIAFAAAIGVTALIDWAQGRFVLENFLNFLKPVAGIIAAQEGWHRLANPETAVRYHVDSRRRAKRRAAAIVEDAYLRQQQADKKLKRLGTPVAALGIALSFGNPAYAFIAVAIMAPYISDHIRTSRILSGEWATKRVPRF